MEDSRLSTSGDTKPDGIDMDKVLRDYIILEFKKQSGLDVQNDKKAMARIREKAEKAKIRLSNLTITDIIYPVVYSKRRKGPGTIYNKGKTSVDDRLCTY